MFRIASILILTLALATPAHAGFDEGVAAYDRGDFATALREWRLLAERGHAESQRNLGAMYAGGRGVPQNNAEAGKWYRLAAEQEYALAHATLEGMYVKGRGVPENDVEAVKWYRLAAEQGEVSAQFALGVMYLEGSGVPESLVHAFAWWDLAAAQGDKNAAKLKDTARDLMSDEQIAEARKLFSEWLRKNPKLMGQ